MQLVEVGRSAPSRPPLARLSWGREMAFFMMGEMGGGGDDSSRESALSLGWGVLLTWRSVREKNLAGLESGLSGTLLWPPCSLRNEVSPNTSPPRPTCMVWRKSPRGRLIISVESSVLMRRLLWDVDTRPLIPGSLPRLMVTENTILQIHKIQPKSL